MSTFGVIHIISSLLCVFVVVWTNFGRRARFHHDLVVISSATVSIYTAVLLVTGVVK